MEGVLALKYLVHPGAGSYGVPPYNPWQDDDLEQQNELAAPTSREPNFASPTRKFILVCCENAIIAVISVSRGVSLRAFLGQHDRSFDQTNDHIREKGEEGKECFDRKNVIPAF